MVSAPAPALTETGAPAAVLLMLTMFPPLPPLSVIDEMPAPYEIPPTPPKPDRIMLDELIVYVVAVAKLPSKPGMLPPPTPLWIVVGELMLARFCAIELKL